MTELQLEGEDQPEKYLLPCLKKSHLIDYSLLLDQVRSLSSNEESTPIDVDEILFLLALATAWDLVVKTLKKIRDFLSGESNLAFLPLVLANAPENIVTEVLAFLATQCAKYGIVEEWQQDMLPENQTLAKIIKTDLSSLKDSEGQVSFGALRESQALEAIVATGDSDFVRSVLEEYDFGLVPDADERIIVGAIKANSLTQKDLNQMNPEMNGNIVDYIFRTFIYYPSHSIFDLLIKNDLKPSQNQLTNLLLKIFSDKLIFISILNQLTEEPNWEEVDKYHILDKQAHLYINRRFPDYIYKLHPRVFNLEPADTSRPLKALEIFAPHLDRVKPL